VVRSCITTFLDKVLKQEVRKEGHEEGYFDNGYRLSAKAGNLGLHHPDLLWPEPAEFVPAFDTLKVVRGCAILRLFWAIVICYQPTFSTG
jgi:hypothetical protein